MAYEFHIERSAADEDSEPLPIRLEEWEAAVAATSGLRLYSKGFYEATNPSSGEVIRVGAKEGDTEVFFPHESAWYPIFHWRASPGSALFKASFEPGDKSHPVWAAAIALASHLGATIRGDDGETYELA